MPRSRSRSRRRHRKRSRSDERRRSYYDDERYDGYSRSRERDRTSSSGRSSSRRKSNFSSEPPPDYQAQPITSLQEQGAYAQPPDRNGFEENPTAASRSFQTQNQQHWGPQGGESQPKEDAAAAANNPLYKANFGLSGALQKDEKTGNTYRGIALKWTEPEDARAPTRRWRLYVFKGDDIIDTLYIHRQSAYLVGRERKIADIPIDHLSCSKQHAVIQYRFTGAEDAEKTVKPYLLDLQSTNGTFINGERVEDSRYYEIKEKDVIKFGESTREYVVLNDTSSK
mmetsp:Transcript_477/g.631  ORF Transcript_477/g.631 Transcript_477/m.631 type:complete len:283 (-) Transcript_477:166-1014(-)